MFSETLYSWRY